MLIFLDTETTGILDDDRLCQLAYKTDQGHTCNKLFKPPLPIKIGAMAIHHITEKMVKNKPVFTENQEMVKLLGFLDSQPIIVAHNAEYDIKMLAKEHPRFNEFDTICTLKIARMLDAEGLQGSHSLQYLRYSYGIEVKAQAHDAWGDILVLEQLFNFYWAKFKEKFDFSQEIIAEMVRITKNPVLIPKMPIGKHKGMHFRDVPQSYLKWMVEQDFDGDLLYTARHYLEQL